MLARSSTSSISASRWRPAVSMCSRRSRWRGVGDSLRSCSSSCEKPSTAFIGVRSSWLTRAMNSDFARLACSMRCLSSHSASERLRSVMSKLMPINSSGLPSASRTAWPRVPSQCTEPSGHTTRSSCAYGSPRAMWRSANCRSIGTSSGWLLISRSCATGRGSSGSNPRRRYICALQYDLASSRRSRSQMPTPAASIANCARSRSRCSSISALRRSVTSRCTP